jgi:twinkle protein
MDSISAILADAGIRGLKRQAAGRRERVRCPQCDGGKDREDSLTVSIDEDGKGVAWRCFRGTCDWRGGKRVRAAQEAPQRALGGAKAAPVRPRPDAEQPRPAALLRFFSDRGIGEDTVVAFGVYAAKHFFPGKGEQPAIVFPYRLAGELVNRKYRAPTKHPQAQDKDALQTLFNVDSILDADAPVVWVEGEPDAMAVHEVGYLQVVSLKDGAPSKALAENDPGRAEGRRFEALSTHSELLGRVKKFVLAGDNDEPGLVLREELARRLGRHRCWLVTWPDGCKDACDVLRAHGRDAVIAAIEAAVPYPIAGGHVVTPAMMLALAHAPQFPVLRTGVRSFDRAISFPGEGRLILLTGIPNGGKTSLLSWLVVVLAQRERRRWVLFSPEHQPWERYAAELSGIYAGKPFWPVPPPMSGFSGVPGMSDAEISSAAEWLAEHVVFLACDAENEAATLDWLLERAAFYVLHRGVTDFAIDPWNEIEHNWSGMTETEYVGRSLRRIKAFAYRHSCNVWVVAHPTKLVPLKPGAPTPRPTLYDISGGANWANKADLGIIVHTPENVTEVTLAKARFSRFGRKNSVVNLEFDRMSGRYSEVIADLVGGSV